MLDMWLYITSMPHTIYQGYITIQEWLSMNLKQHENTSTNLTLYVLLPNCVRFLTFLCNRHENDLKSRLCALLAIFVGNSNVDLFLKCDNPTYLESFTIINLAWPVLQKNLNRLNFNLTARSSLFQKYVDS